MSYRAVTSKASYTHIDTYSAIYCHMWYMDMDPINTYTQTGADLNFKSSSNSNSLLEARRLMRSVKAASHYRMAVLDYINGFYISAFIIEHHLIIIERNATLT